MNDINYSSSLFTPTTTTAWKSSLTSMSKQDQMAIYYVTDNSHIVIPLISFVFGFPILVIVVLCLVQQRNKCYYKKQQQLRLQNQRLSTVSTLHSGLNSTRSLPFERDRANSTFSAGRLSICNGAVNVGRGSIDIQADKSAKPNNQRRSIDPIFGKKLEANIDYKIIDEEKKQHHIHDHSTINNASEKIILVNI